MRTVMLRHSRIALLVGAAACCFVSFFSFAQDTKMFRDLSDGVTFIYPAEWVEKDQRTGMFRILVGDKDAFGGSCSLAIHRNAALAKYSDQQLINETTAKDIENGAKQSGNIISVVGFERTKIGNRPAIFYEFDSSYQSLNITIPLRTLAGMVKVGDGIYVIQCGTTPKAMRAKSNTFIRIISSLIIRG